MSFFNTRDAAVAAPVGVGVLAYGFLLWVLYRKVRRGGRVWRMATFNGRIRFTPTGHKLGAWWTIGVGCLLLSYALVTVVIEAVT